ncbi:MAG: VOC family protein [Methanococcaceae archaeon]
MNLTTCCSVLFVKDIEESKHFYSRLLGLSIDLDFGKNIIFNNGFAIWEIRDDHVIPLKLGLDRISDQRINNFELYFETDDLAEVYNNLKNKQIKFLHEIHEEPWGQQTIRFFDPDNHLIEIGESMKKFVTRFLEMGLTIEQISKRTSVPIEKVKLLLKT